MNSAKSHSHVWIQQPEFLDESIYVNFDMISPIFTIFFMVMNLYLNSWYEFIYKFIIMNSYSTFHDLWIQSIFRYEIMYMKKIVKSFMKSGYQGSKCASFRLLLQPSSELEQLKLFSLRIIEVNKLKYVSESHCQCRRRAAHSWAGPQGGHHCTQADTLCIITV